MIPTLLFVIVEIASREQLAENERRHVHVVVLVDDHRDSLSVVPHRDSSLLLVNCDADRIHRRIVLLVVRRIHQDFVEYLVESRHLFIKTLQRAHISDGTIDQTLLLPVKYPHILSQLLNTADYTITIHHSKSL